ncbi:putative serine protease 45 [Danaus plexippus]|uniref:putative serine protease 45 n=1 Tax=Danaus plexippus TaxID=13037 RepID=UPI002AB07B0A|nr:putative serine protease 45 [Danaus plexippus]
MRFEKEMYISFFIFALCGVASGSVNRIANGKLAAPGQFPYMVSIQILGPAQNLQTRGHRCAGALISYRQAVTTASCMFNYNSSVPQLINSAELRVFAGSTSLYNDVSADFIRPVLNITVHPNFSGLPALVNNIAVITLVTPFPNQVVTPLSLPAADFNPPEFTLCSVSGWGGINSSELVNAELRFATKYVYNQNLCTLYYNTLPNTKNILPSMICAVSYDLRSSNCDSDLGNPLVCGDTFTGVLSVPDRCSVSSFPEVYTRISNYTTWIRSVSGASKITGQGLVFMFLLFPLTGLF